MSEPPASRVEVVLEQDSTVLVAYLFGSKSKGLETSKSDTDVAVFLSELPDDMLNYYLGVVERLSRVLGQSVDLVVLNTSTPFLRHQVIKYGRVLYSRSQRTRVEFEAKAEREYLDLRVRRSRYDQALMQEISKCRL